MLPEASSISITSSLPVTALNATRRLCSPPSYAVVSLLAAV
jgi:hypothetical protein